MKFKKNFIPKKYGVEFGFINEKDKNILKHIDNKVFAKDSVKSKKKENMLKLIKEKFLRRKFYFFHITEIIWN